MNPPKVKTKKAPRIPRVQVPLELTIPSPVPEVRRWLVLGLDPSLSCTGYALSLVEKSADGVVSTDWLEVGSVKPGESSDPVWVRSKAVALAIRRLLDTAILDHGLEPSMPEIGLIISFEAPTPNNDFLTSISRILHLVLLEPGERIHRFARIHVQMTNAATLRSLMGLVLKGTKNKVENKAKAYTFLSKERYPNLDSDACDAVLMSIMARYTAFILLGAPEEVPELFLTTMCNAALETVGKGRNAHTRIKGILHRAAYWTSYTTQDYAVKHCDARVKKSRLDRFSFTI